ncbi:bacillithiol biosynthesis deacetylase BshB1 [Paenibacillus radicis (ex Gao et al. 2016)]|uniref:Bacillithiol biosynthesis deacetylase BshB1 n=1 Tax=Paenibacillus radicis (ex Gao et al. 2016) TaxID=1737354 RepID=A0A917GVE8_9BACL|nr:bacillithiol biosynthesis deacetylase BshB1 [Paenibacillus radicis (ex Gao et al. 2016)]GGG58469.1 bacillithiol biosynthesis deacetylase BshB1 [Paenibacillus radicis (ex Gao et al. 2016)]
MTQLDILIFGAHADDAEIGMGGTIAKHTAAGLRVGICDLTKAEMSSNGTVELRLQEAEEASKVLGLASRTNLGLPDRGLTLSRDHIDAVVAEIRRTRPRIVFAPYGVDRHPDHIACSKIVEEAVFNAKLRRYMPELPAVQVQQLIYYYINDVDEVSLAVDVSNYYEAKLASLSAYRSQFQSASEGDRVATPLTDRYIERVAARDLLLGQTKGWKYAEGFAIKQPFAVDLF